MKRILPILLAAAMVFSLAACGDPTPTPSQTAPVSTEPAAEQTAEPTPEVAAPAEGGKVLVAYYSATNHTEAVAQTIADAMGGDLFELVPAQPYTSDDLNWTNDDSRVSREHNDPALQDQVELENTTPDNWADYDTVFIG